MPREKDQSARAKKGGKGGAYTWDGDGSEDAMPLEMGRDLYEVLGVPRGSDARTIKRGFREAARKYHPDVNNEPDAADVYKEISQAYSVLSDPDKKARYDQFGEAGLGGGGGGPGGGVEVNLEDIFDSLGGVFSMSRRSVINALPPEVTLEDPAVSWGYIDDFGVLGLELWAGYAIK